MERKFRITVDGRMYNVTVEDLSEGGNLAYAQPGSMTAPPPQVAAPAAVAATPAAAPVARGSAGPADVTCTLGGVVESIIVTVGQAVNQGDKVVVIEAMKMKTPMVAHRSGKVGSIAVKVGEAVETGQVLLTIS
jgi:biotin carboxyl carrier protein